MCYLHLLSLVMRIRGIHHLLIAGFAVLLFSMMINVKKLTDAVISL